MPTVYIETTIPSYYFETRTTAQAIAWRRATRVWWDMYRSRYKLITSRYVLEELAAARPPKSTSGAAMLADAQLVDELPRTLEVAAYYLDHKLIPRDNMTDAVHLALASIHKADFLLTWNCLHLANDNKAKHIAVLNKRLKLAVPNITTPYTLLPQELDR
jgi:hypothetical protein